MMSDEAQIRAKRQEDGPESPIILGQRLRKDRSRPHLDKLPFSSSI